MESNNVPEEFSQLSFNPCPDTSFKIKSHKSPIILPQFQSYHAYNFSKCSEHSKTPGAKTIHSEFYLSKSPIIHLSHEISNFSQSYEHSQILIPAKVPIGILLTELNENLEEFNKKIEVSKLDNSVISPNLETLTGENLQEKNKKVKNRPFAKSGYENLTIKTNKSEVRALNSSEEYFRSLSIRENLSASIRKINLFEIFDFVQAFNVYSSSEFPMTKVRSLWKLKFIEKFCRCFVKPAEIDQQSLEACEKIVNFAYTPFNNLQIFHRNLLISAFSLISNAKIQDEDLGKIFNDCLSKVNCMDQGALLKFFSILFLGAFFPDVLKVFKESFSESENFQIFGRICRMNLNFLREKKMNQLIVKSQKCLEVFLFVFAGLCLKFLALVRVNKSGMLAKLEKISRNKLAEILCISQKHYIDHSPERQ